MDINLYDKNGMARAYISDDYNETVYLWNGHPVARIYEGRHVYGMNGKHLGWFIDSVMYNNEGERIGFTFESCPVTVTKAPGKPEKYPADEIKARWSSPPLPGLAFVAADKSLEEFLKQGQIPFFKRGDLTDKPEEK